MPYTLYTRFNFKNVSFLTLQHISSQILFYLTTCLFNFGFYSSLSGSNSNSNSNHLTMLYFITHLVKGVVNNETNATNVTKTCEICPLTGYSNILVEKCSPVCAFVFQLDWNLVTINQCNNQRKLICDIFLQKSYPLWHCNMIWYQYPPTQSWYLTMSFCKHLISALLPAIHARSSSCL